MNDFMSPDEQRLIDAFLTDYYVVVPVENRPGLDRIRTRMAEIAAQHLKIAMPNDPHGFMDTIGERVDAKTLNDLRLAVFAGINAEPWFRPTYLSLARRAVEVLVGNELAMQRRVNLSIQLPDDVSSLLHTHADVWDGDSAYELVMWLPLVDCFSTKSMYIVPAKEDRAWQSKLSQFAQGTAEDIYKAVAPDARFLDVPFGSILLFSQTVMHGNRVNAEPTTRWSMNCRVKSLLSPYADKQLGEFFEPIVVRPATRIGATYALPQGFQ
jgi:sporadic carbohydrate cluster 2OG-Fe(II) oxygenase